MIGQTVTVLLVEDNDVDVEAVRRGFKRQKIANPIVVAKDGVDALDRLRDKRTPFPRPYIILLDLNMPRMGGVEFLTELRDDDDLRDSIVFVLTTSKAEQDKMDSYRFNVAGYVVKSEVGESFVRLVTMLEHFWRLIEFPPEKTA